LNQQEMDTVYLIVKLNNFYLEDAIACWKFLYAYVTVSWEF